MKYQQVETAFFIDRPNRFIAHCMKKDGEIYIYIYKTTELNEQLYGKIFEYNNIPMQDETLYKVDNEDGIAILTIVQ